MTDILTLKKNCLVVGRGATAIYLALADLQAREVIVPANICYAAVYPVLFSGNVPVFCDVHAEDGNVSLAKIRPHVTERTGAVIVPHMYGNPVGDIAAIQEFCTARGLLLIEDCASAMGATVEGRPVGSFGDYTVYSTGYSKTVDTGNGGLLCSDRALTDLRERYAALPVYDACIARQNELFSKIYRQVRNAAIERECYPVFQVFEKNCRNSFLYKLDAADAGRVLAAVRLLPQAIADRRECQQMYESLLDDSLPGVRKYRYRPGAVPWRFSVYVDADKKKQIVGQLLAAGVPVSDWYPRVTMLFGDDAQYPEAFRAESEILNFPLPCAPDEIRRICAALNEALRAAV